MHGAKFLAQPEDLPPGQAGSGPCTCVHSYLLAWLSPRSKGAQLLAVANLWPQGHQGEKKQALTPASREEKQALMPG